MPNELIVPVDAVHEKLGMTRAPAVPVPVGGKTYNIRRLNIKDTGPAHGVWIDRNATLAWMAARSREAGGNELLEKLIDDLAEVTL